MHRTFSDGAVGRIGHLQTRPAPSGQADPQPPARCEDRHPPEKAVAAQKETGSRGADDADAKTHCETGRYRTYSKEGEGCQEQDKSAEMQTRYDVKLKAHGLYDPQLHQPQQQVSILDGLVEEEASMIVTRWRPLATRDKARIGPDISFTGSQDSVIVL